MAQKFWLVEGEHPIVPGIVRRLCASEAIANEQATELVDNIEEDLLAIHDDMVKQEGTWRERLEAYENHRSCDSEFYVNVEEMELIEELAKFAGTPPDVDPVLQEIADGAWGDGPMVRGLARDQIAKSR